MCGWGNRWLEGGVPGRKKAARTGVGTKLDGPGKTDTILQAVEGLGGEASWNGLEESLGLRLMKRAHRWPFHPGLHPVRSPLYPVFIFKAGIG